MNKAVKVYFKEEFLRELLAVLLYAVGIEIFIAPNQIVTGGVTGVALILNFLFGLPIGTLTLAMNLPLLAIGWKKLGRSFLLRTLRTVALIWVAVDFLMPLFPKYYGEKMLAAVFGGVLLGISLAMVLTSGGSTGGTDIVVKLLLLKSPHISLGNMVMLTDIVVVVAGAIVYRDIETILYGIVLIYVSGEVIDRMVKGSDARWMVLAMSAMGKEISREVGQEIGRGTTLIEAQGGYSGQKLPLMLCIVDAREMFALKKLIKRIDPKAFVIVSQAAEILGEGFKELGNE